MGLFSGASGVVKGMSLGAIDMGDGKDGSRAAAEAAFESRLAAEKGMRQLYESKDYSRNQISGGYGAATDLMQPGSTAGGYASSLADIMGGSDFQPLMAHNRRNLESELSLQGLTRSGSGIRDMSQVPMNTAMQIEQGLYGRKSGLADLYVNQGSSLAGLETNYGRDMANLHTGQGVAQSSAILAGQQADAAQDSQMMNLLGSGMSSAASYYGGR